MKRIFIPIFMLFYMISYSQSGTEIYLFDLAVGENQIKITNPVNITQHQGYDNQPSFHFSEPIIYYSSNNTDGRSDIKYFNYETLETKNLTTTIEREYSPTHTPDGNFISCILQRDNGAQDLVKYPINGGKPIVLIKDLLIGYHAWIDNSKLITYVLLENMGELRCFDLNTNKNIIITTAIGRSLHQIPYELNMSYIDKSMSDNWRITKFDPNTKKSSIIASTLHQREDMVWTQNHLILMSDGRKIYFLNPNADDGWIEVKTEGDFTNIKGITRMALNKENSKLAIVVSE